MYLFQRKISTLMILMTLNMVNYFMADEQRQGWGEWAVSPKDW
jgi:hypothetical protein